MALTDNEKEKAAKRAKRKPRNSVGNLRYSDAQKIEAATSYLALGNLALVGRVMGIPEVTLRVWKATEWWKNLIEDLKMQERIELSARMKRLVEASHVIVAQRLETGDPYINRKGEVDYKPVSIKDAHRVAVDLIDRKKEIDKMLVDNTVVEKEDDKLEKLAERFAEMATKSIQKKFDKQRTVDVEVIDNAVYEEREEGLQEGERTLQLPSGADQETFREDDGTEES